MAAEKIPDKLFFEFKLTDFKFSEGKFAEIRPVAGVQPGGVTLEELVARITALEAALACAGGGQPFIGSNLRPDLSQGALSGETDYQALNADMAAGAPGAKRYFDTKG